MGGLGLGRETVHSLCWADKHGIYKTANPKEAKRAQRSTTTLTYLCVALIQLNGPCGVVQGRTVVQEHHVRCRTVAVIRGIPWVMLDSRRIQVLCPQVLA